MKYTTQGNCPYCDAEMGIHGGWGMSPEGFVEYKRRHDMGHPENQPQTTNDVICPHCHGRIPRNNLNGGMIGN